MDEAFEPPEIDYGPPDIDPPDLDEANALPSLATSSSYAVQALMGGLVRPAGPEEETAKNTAAMLEKLDKQIDATNNLDRLGFA